MCAWCLYDPPVGGEVQQAEFVVGGQSACPYHAELHTSPWSRAALFHKSEWSPE